MTRPVQRTDESEVAFVTSDDNEAEKSTPLDIYGLDEQAAAPTLLTPAEESEPVLGRGTAVAKKKKRKKAASFSAALSGVGVAVKIAVAAVLLLLVVLAFFSPVVLVILVVISLLVGVILMLVGAVWMLIVPFQEDVVCGLMWLFVPFYSLYYLISRWDDMRRPFSFYLGGAALAFLPLCIAGRFADSDFFPKLSPSPVVPSSPFGPPANQPPAPAASEGQSSEIWMALSNGRCWGGPGAGGHYDFSIDFRFDRGSAGPGDRYFLMLKPARGQGGEISVMWMDLNNRQGTLQGSFVLIGGGSGPFEVQMEVDKLGAGFGRRQKISNSISLAEGAPPARSPPGLPDLGPPGGLPGRQPPRGPSGGLPGRQPGDLPGGVPGGRQPSGPPGGVPRGPGGIR